MIIGELTKIVKIFRKNILLQKDTFLEWKEDNHVKNFPNNVCDITCEFLQKFLNEEHGFDFIIKEYKYEDTKGDIKYHQYVEDCTYIIDITCSQFNNNKLFPYSKTFPEIIIENNKKDYFFYKEDNIIGSSNYISYEDYLKFYAKIIT